MTAPLDHAPDCRGVVVVTFHGGTSPDRYRLTRCTGCDATHMEPAYRADPVVVEGGCDK